MTKMHGYLVVLFLSTTGAWSQPVALTETVADLMAAQEGEAEALAPDALEELRSEMAAMRAELAALRETLDLLVNQIMADLEAENAQLRATIAEEVPPAKEAGSAQSLPADKDLAPKVVGEWGRSPQDAEDLGGNATSLLGMAAAVPPGASPDALAELGRELRRKYGAYDNINIEIFDDEAAARAYADSHAVDGGHQVLSVSKHAATGRDAIVRYDAGMAIDISF